MPVRTLLPSLPSPNRTLLCDSSDWKKYYCALCEAARLGRPGVAHADQLKPFHKPGSGQSPASSHLREGRSVRRGARASARSSGTPVGVVARVGKEKEEVKLWRARTCRGASGKRDGTSEVGAIRVSNLAWLTHLTQLAAASLRVEH